MFSFATNMSIARRLFLAAALAAVIPGIVIAIMGASYLNTLSLVNQTVDTSNKAVKLANDQQADLLRMNALLTALGNTNANSPTVTVQVSREITNLTTDFDQKLSQYEQDYQIATSANMQSVRSILQTNGLSQQTPVSQRSMIFVVKLQWQAYKGAQNLVLQGLQKKTDTTAALAQSNLLYLPLKGNLDNLVNLTENFSKTVIQVNTAQANPILWGTIMAFLVSTILVFLVVYVVNRTITNPLRQLVSLTTRITKGETNVRATLIGHDEIYMVANSMNTMLDNIVRLMQEAQNQRDTLQARIDILLSEVKGIAGGDLSMQARVTPDAIGFLASSFNYMIKELGGLVIRIKVVAHEVENLTVMTVERMTQLVELADTQIQQIATSTQEVRHMAASTRQVAERAQKLHNISLETRQVAQNGRHSVQQTVEKMGHIVENVHLTAGNVQLLAESSREINNIVEVISHIAYQTNRLSLDAAVQAAMAGENGKAFAAVASDIRRLAELTKNQASMIATIVRNVNENIGKAGTSMRDTEQATSQGMGLAQQAGTALVSIFDAVEWQAKEIETINQMANQQLQSSKSIVATMQHVSEATEQGSAGTRDASQNMWRLAQLVEQLRISVEAFKLRENRSRYLLGQKEKRPISSPRMLRQ
ncbi:MAG TPA: methyl-accepting chemotaxis protein [Ktedonosporobacter sp.]|nr:methyl-accepting chemotaxis protein [Ktedonosporobacter sp.]